MTANLLGRLAMRPLAKVGLVGAGYVGAFALAAAVVAAYVLATSGADRQHESGMAAFGGALLFLAVFSVAATAPTGAALYFLRPHRAFWRALSTGNGGREAGAMSRAFDAQVMMAVSGVDR